MADVDFRLFSVTHAPYVSPVFPIRENVKAVHAFSLWGTREPGCQAGSWFEVRARKSRTTSDRIAGPFLDAFRAVARCTFEGGKHPEILAEALLDLHLYFKRFDFVKSMQSREAWSTFLDVCEEFCFGDQEFSLHDATTCMRWLQRFLGILTFQLPRTDLTHSAIAGLASVPGVLKKLLHGTPFLLTEHGIYLRELYLWLRKCGYSHACRRFLLNFNEALVKMNYHFADCITALGNFNKDWQLKLGANDEKIILAPNGSDPKLFRPVRRADTGRVVVLTMARIHQIKGIDHLLRAAAIVLARVPNALFRILGEAADEDYFRKCEQIVAENGIAGAVEFGVSNDPASAYSQADLFCLPSISEGMPYSVLEAMFSERAIVATDVGNVREMLEGTGIVVRPADPEELARALLTLLEGDGAAEYRRSLAVAARKRAESMYTIDHAITRFRDLYECLIHDRSSSQMFIAARRALSLGPAA
jgi:glycosyltransferase involved in cell wall biosynthesis